MLPPVFSVGQLAKVEAPVLPVPKGLIIWEANALTDPHS